MKKIFDIALAFAAILPVCSCSMSEDLIPGQCDGGMLMVKYIMPEMEVQTKADADHSFFAYLPEKFAEGTVEGMSSTMSKGGYEYYELPENVSSVMFSNIGADGNLHMASENGNPVIALSSEAASPLLESEILWGSISQISGTGPYNVPLSRLSSKFNLKFDVVDFEGEPMDDSFLSHIAVTVKGVADKITFGTDNGLSNEVSGSREVPVIINRNSEQKLQSASYHFIPGTSEPELDVNVVFSDGSTKNFNTKLSNALQSNREYTIALKLKRANGSASFTLEDPEVKEYTLSSTPGKLNFIDVEDFYCLTKEEGSSLFIYVHPNTPYDWTFEIIEGEDFFKVELSGKNILTITALSENLSQLRNGVLRIKSETGHYKDIYISQANGNKQTIRIVKGGGNGYAGVLFRGINIEIDTGNGFVAYEGGEIQFENDITVRADVIMSMEQTSSYAGDIWLEPEFTDCVNLTSLGMYVSDAKTDLNIEGLPALKSLHIKHAPSLKSITFDKAQTIENLICENCGFVDLDLTSIGPSLKSFEFIDCDEMVSLKIYPDTYSGSRNLERVKFYSCSRLQGVSFANYERLNDVKINSCYSINSINLSGCTSLSYLKCTGAKYLNINGCTSLKTLNLAGNEFANFLHDNCVSLETINIYETTRIDEFDCTNFPSLKNIYMKGRLQSVKVNLSGCSNIRMTMMNDADIFGLEDFNAENCPYLTKLDLIFYSDSKNPHKLNLKGCSALSDLSISKANIKYDYNDLTNLNKLHIYLSPIGTMDLNRCTKLEDLYISDCEEVEHLSLPKSLKKVVINTYSMSNYSGEMDLSDCSELETVDISNIRSVSNLNFSGCNKLTYAELSQIYVQDVNFQGCTALSKLDIRAGQISKVNLEHCSSLKEMIVMTANLKSLDLSSCKELMKLDCSYNELEANELNKMFTTLPDRSTNVVLGELRINNNPGTDSCDRNLALNKNWYFPVN